MIRYSETRLDVVYERHFMQPAFQISRSAVEILTCFYETLSPDFSLTPSDLTSSTAQSMGDIAIRVNLFGGNGLLELTAAKFAAKFEGLRNQADAETVKKALLLSEAALNKTLPDWGYSGTVIRLSSWLSCDGGEKNATEFFAKFGVPKVKIRTQDFGAKEITYSVNWKIKSEAEGWAIKVLMEPSELPGSHLFLLLSNAYMENAEFGSFESRSDHLEKFYRELLKHYELVPLSTDSEER